LSWSWSASTPSARRSRAIPTAGGEHAKAQAVHGTAPDIAGRGIANPSALILSTALLLNWFDLGVRNAISGGAATPDLGGDVSTDAFATTVITALEAA
jgi:3-isopropylmalate dehydrogenase